jgi:hypothetical protein
MLPEAYVISESILERSAPIVAHFACNTSIRTGIDKQLTLCIITQPLYPNKTRYGLMQERHDEIFLHSSPSLLG